MPFERASDGQPVGLTIAIRQKMRPGGILRMSVDFMTLQPSASLLTVVAG